MQERGARCQRHLRSAECGTGAGGIVECWSVEGEVELFFGNGGWQMSHMAKLEYIDGKRGGFAKSNLLEGHEMANFGRELSTLRLLTSAATTIRPARFSTWPA